MKNFVFFSSSGDSFQASGFNMIDALWRVVGLVPNLKNISSYQEGENPVTCFAR